MDPASAIGVASAAITFLNFSIDVCKTFSQIVTSEEGITKHHADIAATVKKYKEMAEALKTKGDSAATFQLGAAISSAVEESIGVYTELLALVERLGQAKDVPVIGTLKAVYRSMRSREHVERLQRKAETSRSMIIQGLLEATWETSTLDHESSTKAFQHLDKQDIEILAALKAGNSDLLRQLIESRRHFDTTVSDLQDSIRTDHDHITQKIDSLTQRVTDMDRPDLKKAFVDSLFFPDFERREKALSGPSPKTFEWIFNQVGVADSTPSRQVRWPSFPQWLENTDSSQQYWLSGKAGSGKSTLMAHIIRDEMALNRTEGHLKKWHGTKTLHILKFFLFRPGREQQAGLESLLRSLLYQLVNSVPLLQETLMARFLRQSCGARIPTWPVEKLKSMLKSALDAADECCFLIFIDGADEFEDFQHLGGRSVDATDLVDFLFDIQQPQHVKLCISSRPELRITNVHPSFLEAKLADLNHDDIRCFVDEQMQAMTAIPELECRNDLAREIAHRANGIFLWAAFAVTQMKKACRDGHGEDYLELLKRLDDMGKDLNDAILQMLRGLEKSHRPALAFYLQALKSWKDCNMGTHLRVGLVAASRYGEEIQTRSQFLAACRGEQRDIQSFSQGIIEVRDSRRTPDKGQLALVRSRSDQSSESHLQHETLDFEPGEGAWVTVAHDDHHVEITKFFEASVSLIHRSAYDFFFASNHWNEEHVAQCRSLFDLNEESSVPVKVQAGLRKLLWIRPCLVWTEISNSKQSLSDQISACSRDTINYTMNNASPSLTKKKITKFIDDLLSSMRLELLLGLVEAPILETRKHIPGDIFSPQLYNGCLRTLDEDSLTNFESTGLRFDQSVMTELESRFLSDCTKWKPLYDYIQNRLSASNGRAVAPFVQASLLKLIVSGNHTLRPWFTDERQKLLLNPVQRWIRQLNHSHRSLESYKFGWQWIDRLIPSHDTSRSGSSRGRRLMVENMRGSSFVIFQWTPLLSCETTGWHEETIIRALVSYSMLFVGPPGDIAWPRALDRLTQIMRPWDVWIRLLHSGPRARNTRTALFVRFGSLSPANLKMCEEHPKLLAGRYRLTCVARHRNSRDSPRLPLSFDIHPSIALYDGSEFSSREHNSVFPRAAPLLQKQVDILIDAVRQSMELDEEQKDCMIEGIKAFEFGFPSAL